MFTVNYVEQSSLKMLTARRVHHLQISFTKTIYSNNSEEVRKSNYGLWGQCPFLTWMDRIKHSSDPPQSSLHSTAEDCDCLLGGKNSGSGTMGHNLEITRMTDVTPK